MKSERQNVGVIHLCDLIGPCRRSFEPEFLHTVLRESFDLLRLDPALHALHYRRNVVAVFLGRLRQIAHFESVFLEFENADLRVRFEVVADQADAIIILCGLVLMRSDRLDQGAVGIRLDAILVE